MRRGRTLVLVSVGVGLATALAIPARLGIACRLAGGWNGAALAMNVVMWWLIVRCDAEHTRQHCAGHDLGRRIGWIIIAASGISLFATAALLREADVLAPDATHLFTVLCLLAIGNAWILTHTAYAFRYAHLYYDDDERGLAFLGDTSPSYFDFAYFAGGIAMTFGVTDVRIASPRIRRTVLPHAALAFASNTAILATAVNLTLAAFR